MEDIKRQSTMWADLLTSEILAQNAQHRVTRRALIYLDCGLSLDQVLDALKISRATWYRRVSALGRSEEENKEAASRLASEPLVIFEEG